MTATQRPRRAAAPQQRPEIRTPLRLVLPDDLSPQVRRRRARLLVVAGGVATALALLGVVSAHVVLAQEQFRLSKLQANAAAEQARNEQLRLEVSQLESPERIVAAAQERLGMVTPPTVTYLAPGGAATKLRSAPAAAPSPSSPGSSAGQTGGSSTSAATSSPKTSSPTTQPQSTTGGAAGGPAHPSSSGAAPARQ